MRLGNSSITANGGNIGSSQSIADTMYSATNHPFLRGKESVYNINNPPLGMLEHFQPQEENSKKFEGLQHFTQKSPRHQT